MSFQAEPAWVGDPQGFVPLPGGSRAVPGGVWIYRVLSVGSQHPSAIRRHSGLAEV